MVVICHLDGVMVHGFKPSQGDEFLRVIKIHCTPPFGEKVKPEAPCRFAACKRTLRA